MWYDPGTGERSGHMKRLRHWLLNFAAAVSLFCCVGICVLWALSYPSIFRGSSPNGMYLGPGRAVIPSASPRWEIWSRNGWIILYQTRAFQTQASAAPPPAGAVRVPTFIVQMQDRFSVPHAVPMLLSLVLPALAIRQHRRMQKLRREGHCPTCGYDLRATPDRCPECGAIPSAAKGAAA
jgi:hypothetical protein